MRIAVLTTETLHHAKFVKELQSNQHELLVISETAGASAPYDVQHPFERDRDEYEATLWFAGQRPRLASFAETRTCESINDPVAIRALVAFAPELAISFGVGRMRSEIVAAGSGRLLNLHGGDPERYRGLDSHLWAIWHRDFGSLLTCLHRVDDDLDTGDIVAVLPIPIMKGMRLHELRSSNTAICIELALLAVRQINQRGCITSFHQRTKGRYYSFMPSALKSQCLVRFERHAA